MELKPFTIEIKYDGERSQLHKDGNKYKYFSRSGKEYSSVFGDYTFCSLGLSNKYLCP